MITYNANGAPGMIRQRTKIQDGFRSETVRRRGGFIGRVVTYQDGKRLSSFETGIRRLSRGDALRDARQAIHDLIIRRFQSDESRKEEA